VCLLVASPQVLRKQREKDEQLAQVKAERDAENARRCLERKLQLHDKVRRVGGTCNNLRSLPVAGLQLAARTRCQTAAARGQRARTICLLVSRARMCNTH
jgi:hypothetical protein